MENFRMAGLHIRSNEMRVKSEHKNEAMYAEYHSRRA